MRSPELVRPSILVSMSFAAGLLVTACTTEKDPSVGLAATGHAVAAAPAVAELPIDHEPAPRSDAAFRWRDAENMTGKLMASSQLLFADLTNSVDRVLTGRLVLVAAGLDGRVIERPLETFALSVGASREVRVPVRQLPIQSEISTAFLAIVAEVDRPQGMVRISTAPLYYRFQNAYREAAVYNVHEAGKIPNGGLLTQDLMDVRGRILEVDGSFTDAAVAAAQAAAEAVASGKARQGLSTFGRVAVDPATGKGVKPPFAAGTEKAPSANEHPSYKLSSASQRLYSHWWVQYGDSGMGEDYFTSSAWFYARASFAFAYINDARDRNLLAWESRQRWMCMDCT